MRLISTAGAGLLAITMTACTSSGKDVLADKAGAPAPVHVLMADSQAQDAPTGQAMAAFANNVRRLSGGSISVETRSAGEYADNAGDARVVAALTSGRIQLAVVPTRAWSDAGVTTTDVLQAPLEVKNNAHMIAVAHDDVLIDKALGGLPAKGAHGLGVFPERLRILVGFGKPLAHPDDFAGGSIRSISSSVGKTITALGGKPINPTDDAYAQMRGNHTIRGAESSWSRLTSLASEATATADVVLYAKFDSFAANEAWWAGLSAAQRGILVQAATATRDGVVVPSSAEEANAFCSAGGRIVVAGAAAVAKFAAAVAPIVGRVDPKLLAALRADKPATAEAAPEACAPVPDGLDPSLVVADGGDLPDGVYRLQYTQQTGARWNAQGGTNFIAFEGQDAIGTWRTWTTTWTLKRGHYTFELTKDAGKPFRRTGVYQVKGDQLLLKLDPEIGNVVNRVMWHVNADKSLTMTQVDDLKRDMYYGLPWIRIGGV